MNCIEDILRIYICSNQCHALYTNTPSSRAKLLIAPLLLYLFQSYLFEFRKCRNRCHKCGANTQNKILTALRSKNPIADALLLSYLVLHSNSIKIKQSYPVKTEKWPLFYLLNDLESKQNLIVNHNSQ